MEKNNIKKSLEKSYQILQPFSEKYKADFKRFLFSLDLLALEGAIKEKRILDIGSGIGIMAIALNNLEAQTIGIDKLIFPEEEKNLYTITDFGGLKRIWEENGFKTVKADAAKERLPFGDRDFDVIICDATIEHLDESPKNFFREARRILKNGGLFLVTTPNLANLLKRLRFLTGRSPYWDIKDYFNEGSNFRGHKREFTMDELVKMLEWSSFEIVKKVTKNIFWNPKRLFAAKKMPAQICDILSYPFSSMREMIYVLAKK